MAGRSSERSGEAHRCPKHGDSATALVCKHLQHGAGCGYHAADATNDDRWPDAWCDLCDVVFRKEGTWKEGEARAIVPVCTGCYEVFRSVNSKIPEPIPPGQTELPENGMGDFGTATTERTQARQDQAMARTGFMEKPNWDYDDQTATMRFFDDPTDEAVVADVTFVGSFSIPAQSWLWSWANQSVSPRERRDIFRTFVFGEVRGMQHLTTPSWPAEEGECWAMTAIAADLLGAEAVYRAPMGNLLVFMLLNNFRTETPG